MVKWMQCALAALTICLVTAGEAMAQQRKPAVPPVNPSSPTPVNPGSSGSTKPGPKPYKEVITDKAVTDSGLFTVHKVEDKFFFEIPDSLLGRDVLVVNRISKASAGMRNFFFGYAGDQIGSNVIRFEKGPSNRIFIRKISYNEFSRDSSMPLYRAVMNSNIQPIAASFNINAYGKDSTSSVVDITDYINSDNDVLFFTGNSKTIFQIGTLQADKSYPLGIKSYPLNLEIKTVKTYSKGSGPSIPGLPTLPASTSSSGPGTFFTLELNSSIVVLPRSPMRPRYYDPRIGFFAGTYVDFDKNPQGVKQVTITRRWRLEPKDEDVERYKKGELVEPKKPIVFYIDPATPKKWVPYLIKGVNDWQPAFEKAGFKNAIMAKEAPTGVEDSSWSIEDARFSAIVYKPSDVENASGPNVNDPRSGEILESHINWYHNVMKLLRDWYFVQCAAVDPRSRKIQFEDSLMGELVRFVSSHEVGHTLGLRHNFGSSSTVSVDKLRDKAWVEANGHTPSIMDYARFNYVAQPEDGIGEKGLFPRIGDYDRWAIEWGYRWMPEVKSADEEVPILNKLTIERLKNKRLWFGTESNSDDPRSQNEDLGDNAMKAGVYGIKNLQRIVPNLLSWTKTENDGYEELENMYQQVVTQYGRYLGHAAKNIGGIMETPKTSEQAGLVYEFVPRATQKEAMDFLNKHIFTTPTWLIEKDVLNRTGSSAVTLIGTRQEQVLGRLISNSTIGKLINMESQLGNSAYKVTELMTDLKNSVWTEVPARKAVDVYRRNLQKIYIERIATLINPPSLTGITFTIGTPVSTLDARKSDLISVLKGTLRGLRSELRAALPAITDRMTQYHYQDVIDRIDTVLDTGK